MLAPCAVLLCLATAAEPSPQIHRHGSTFDESAVLVENAALVHTSQLIARADATSTVDEELEDVFHQLDGLLADVDSSRADLVKLNLYVADDGTAAAASDFLSTWCPNDARPAVATVVTALPEKRRFAADGVFVARGFTGTASVVHRPAAGGSPPASPRTARMSILP